MTGRAAGTLPSAGRWAVVLAGAVALAVAMGIGRFAFTPLLPMMLHDGVIDLPSASWLASANYLGYLAGALLCTFQPWIWARVPRLPPVQAPWMVRAGLVATGVLTLGMALPWPAAWPLLRFAAGVTSAFVFVYVSGWVLSQMARLQAPAMGGVMYTGPGAGIVVSGLFASAMVQWQWQAVNAWLVFGVLAFVLSALVWRSFGRGETARPAAAASAAAAGEPHSALEVGFLCVAYGIAGFGYIVTATFLPVIARAALPGSPWLDLFWPIFGFGVFCGALIASRLRISADLRLLLAGSYAIQAAGIAVGVWSPSLAGFAIGSLMLGLPFTAITFFAMQEVRRLRPALAASFMGLATAMYGIGQIVGPPLVALLLRHSASAGAGFTRSLQVAMGSLLVGALIYLWMVRAYPMRRTMPA
ncbi:MAG: YbfB/YjiJ family MFS transporter [Burkholderiales bacterium]|nr:YbfB/YjiJ family MFS transporter [Burkholderiales bacterium]